MRDFMMEKYEVLCHALLGAGYTPVTVYRYLTGAPNGRTVILRHDVDRRPENALKMAILEHALDIVSTYYFRHPYTFIPETIRRILSLGHEVGYHYEVLSKAGGDYRQAITLFIRELEEFRTLCDVRTISMHGSPLSRYDNRDLWKRYDFEDYGIEGEAYLSMAGRRVRYLTDTGRNWSGKHSVRDAVSGVEGAVASVESTDDLVDWIGSSGEDLYLTVHPERWAASEKEWVRRCLADFCVNLGKRFLA